MGIISLSKRGHSSRRNEHESLHYLFMSWNLFFILSVWYEHYRGKEVFFRQGTSVHRLWCIKAFAKYFIGGEIIIKFEIKSKPKKIKFLQNLINQEKKKIPTTKKKPSNLLCILPTKKTINNKIRLRSSRRRWIWIKRISSHYNP